MSDAEEKILHALQFDFPVTSDPLAEVARRLDLASETVRITLQRLLAEGTIRRFGPVFDARGLGFVSTLVAGEVSPEDLDRASKVASAHREVTHNYVRGHAKNLWFTIIARDDARLEEILAAVSRAAPRGRFLSLPAIRVFKIAARFSSLSQGEQALYRHPESRALTDEETRLGAVLEDGLPLGPAPFEELAGRAGLSEAEVLATVKDWLARGVLRRLGAVVRHTRVGFAHNGMCVFEAAPGTEEAFGHTLASSPRVTHGYQRRTAPDWPYTHYAMAHGTEPGEVEAWAAQAAQDGGALRYAVLFTERELKKTSMRYFSE